jgi:O-succinylbenzoic acid--CoA ligase
MLARLLDDRGDRPFPASLRAALIGGAAAPAAVLERAAALSMRALPTYGLTEAASQVATLPPREWPRGLASAGRPLPYTQVEIRGSDGRAVAPGVEGEIVVRGPTVMAGYLGTPEETQAAMDGRWLRTGDVGAWDDEGRLLVLDRRADRIVTGGENVSPEEVETVIVSHPAVAQACVVGLPSREWGSEVAAAVVLLPGRSLSLEELRAHAGSRLSGFKLPRYLVAVDALPRSAGGKLLRRVVRERLLDEMAKQKHP